MSKRATNQRKKKSIKQMPNATRPQEASSKIYDFLKFGESYTSLLLGIIVVVIATVLLLSFVHGKNTNITVTSGSTVAQEKEPTSIKVAGGSGVTIYPTSVSPQVKKTVTTQPTPTRTTPTALPTTVPTKTVMVIKAVSNPTLGKDNRTYTVAVGDDLWNIAEKFYNNGYAWVEIARANNLSNPNLIHSGNKIVLPQVKNVLISTVTSGTKTINSTTPVTTVSQPAVVQTDKITGSEYTVVKGDSLWNVSVRAYGDGYKWTAIAQANGLTNPDVIHSGNVLKIPRNS